MDYCSINYVSLLDSPVFISEAGPVGSHSELPEELTEPFLDLDPLLSAFIPAGSLSASEAVAVINSRVVEARHAAAKRGPAVTLTNKTTKTT